MSFMRPLLFTALLLWSLSPELCAQSSGNTEETPVYYPVKRVVDR